MTRMMRTHRRAAALLAVVAVLIVPAAAAVPPSAELVYEKAFDSIGDEWSCDTAGNGVCDTSNGNLTLFADSGSDRATASPGSMQFDAERLWVETRVDAYAEESSTDVDPRAMMVLRTNTAEEIIFEAMPTGEESTFDHACDGNTKDQPCVIDMNMSEFSDTDLTFLLSANGSIHGLSGGTASVKADYVKVYRVNTPPAEPAQPSPEDGATGVSTPVELGVNVTDPDADSLTARFYHASDHTLIGSDTVSGTGFANVTWNGLSGSTTYDWYVNVTDGTNTTRSPTWSFTTKDATAPSISFTAWPSGTIADSTPWINGTTDEMALIEYRVDSGSYQTVCSLPCSDFNVETSELSSGDHTITVRATDAAGNSNTRSTSFTVATGDEVSFDVAVSRSYPESAIPIDPDSDVWDTDTSVDFNFSLIHPDGTVYDISNRYEDGICDFHGDLGWHLGSNFYCGSEVPPGIPIGVDYTLKAEWRLSGHHERVLDENFYVADDYIWTTSRTSHGGSVEDSVSYDVSFSKDTGGSDTVATCTGSTMHISGINSVTMQCTDGVTSPDRPPVVAFIYNDAGERIANTNNNMFSGDCSFHDGVTWQDLKTSTRGYKPKNCNIGWQMDGGSSFDAYTFNNPGDYSVRTIMVNAVSDSPDYICPGTMENNNLCDVGSLSSRDHSGYTQLNMHSIKAVNITLRDQSVSFSGGVIRDGSLIRRDDYSGDITLSWTVKNTGVGEARITGLPVSCPANVDCSVQTSLPVTVDEGGTATITVSISPQKRAEGTIDLTLEYDDGYSLGCTDTKTMSRSFTLDEIPPETSSTVIGGVSEHQWYRTDAKIEAACQSTGAPCQKTEYRVLYDGPTRSDQYSGSGDYTFTFNVSREGNNTVQLWSTDTLGNNEYNPDGDGNLDSDEIASRFVPVDKSAPDISCNNGCDQPDPVRSGKKITFRPTIDDPLSGRAQVTICRSSSCSDPFCSYGAKDESCSWQTPENTYQVEQYCVKAVDRAGNPSPVVCDALGGETGQENFSIKKWRGASCQQNKECLIGPCIDNLCTIRDVPPPKIKFKFKGKQ